jgi:hypothetical protein
MCVCVCVYIYKDKYIKGYILGKIIYINIYIYIYIYMQAPTYIWQGVVRHACNPSIWETEAGRSGV